MTNIPKIVIGLLLVVWMVMITNSCYGQAERTKVTINKDRKYLQQATESTKEAMGNHQW